MSKHTVEERLAALEAAVERLSTVVDEGTPAGQYTTVVEALMKEHGWTAEEATTNFNNVLNSVGSEEGVGK